VRWGGGGCWTARGAARRCPAPSAGSALGRLRRARDGGRSEARGLVGGRRRSPRAGAKGAAPAPGTHFEVGF
jgi:hypothetical protein